MSLSVISRGRGVCTIFKHRASGSRGHIPHPCCWRLAAPCLTDSPRAAAHTGYGGEQGGLYCSLFQGELCSHEGLQVMRKKGVPDRSSSHDYCSLQSRRLPDFSQARRSSLDPDSVGTGDPQDEVNAAKPEGRIWLWRVLKHLDSEELCAARGWIYLCQIRFQEHREVLKCEADVLLKPTYSPSITPRGSAVR